MISRDPTLWYETIEIDKGSDDGVHVGDPVIGDGALVGDVTTVDPTVSFVTLITDHTMAVAARGQDPSGDSGVLVPAVGNPNQLLLQYLPSRAHRIQTGQQVVTVGFKSGPLRSLYPPGIPIGTVANANQNSLLNNGQVQVTPGRRPAPLRRRPDPDQRRMRAPQRAQAPIRRDRMSDRCGYRSGSRCSGSSTVVIQEAAVSQISIFGVSADLTPLVVMSVGLLAGSMPGAIMGFATGLLVDMVLVQTLGVTSLLYIAIGYWSGRLRELRDPSHGLVPLALGAAATAFAGIGMAVIQFLLGVDAPVSLLLLQQIFITVLVNTLIALPVYAVVRRMHPAGAARGSAPPPPPRVHDRRPQPAAAALRAARADAALGLAMIQLPDDRRPPLTPQLALRVAILGSFALAMFAIIFFRLWFLQVLSGDKYLAQASVNRVRDIDVPAPRGRDPRPQRQRPGRSKRAIAVQISPPTCRCR